MAELATLIICLLAGSFFLATVFFGAPFIPSRRRLVHEALDMLDLRPGETLLELGSGDGRVLLAAAKRGIRTVGYEINPLLVLYSRLRTIRYRSLVTIHACSYWSEPLPACDAVYVFLMRPYMARLAGKLAEERHGSLKPIKVVSLSFAFPHKEPLRELGELRLYKF